jgi:hypothetical protein
MRVQYQILNPLKSTNMDKITRSERVLSNAVKAGELTDSGRDFLIAALDPFHDSQLKDLQGWPDLETASSVVRLIKQTQSITTNQGATANWDCYIDLWPFLNTLNFNNTANHTYTGKINDAILYDTVDPQSNFGGLSIAGVLADGTMNYGINSNFIRNITLPDAFAAGTQRVVGIGFEVVNTTAPLHKQGQAIVYRQPNSVLSSTGYRFFSLNNNAGFTAQGTYTCGLLNSPPTSIADTMLLPGSRQWPAGEGCYVVGCFAGSENPPTMVNYTTPVIGSQDGFTDVAFNQLIPPALPLDNSTNVLFCPPLAPQIGARQLGAANPCIIHPLHGCGARLIGLSPETSLSVTLNIYLETFPTPSDRSILVLATPSAQYDPVALEIFSHALTYLPVGVPVRENGLGEWFQKAMSLANEYIAPAADLFGFPLVGTTIRMAKTATDQYMTPPSPIPRAPRNSLVAPKRPKKLKKSPNSPTRSPTVVNIRKRTEIPSRYI